MPWYEGEALNTVTFAGQRGGTLLTGTTLYDSRETRDGVLKSPMDEGVEASYDMLDTVLSSLVTPAA
ncbi:MAG TPA: hypothetical protein VM686_04810 [Polyangiaceae bacterium]|nr:hypothetical protein [Polyangiaceae bacterium]